MNKYNAKKTTVDNITFDSKKEAVRYQELKLLERAGEIHFLKLQPKFSIDVYGEHICNYFADFAYIVDENIIYEDVKGVKTPVYRIKKKLVEAIYGIEITEV